MINTQLVIVFVGWAFLFYLNNRTLRRSELSRLKDNLTKALEDLFDWLDETARKQELGALELEEALASKISLIEFRFRQLNDYAKFTLFDPTSLAVMREIDTAILVEQKKLPQHIHNQQYDILEQIEQSYHQHYFKQSFFARIWISRKDDLTGVIAGLSLSILFFILVRLTLN
ncbi:MAG: hypothetical protein ACI8WB_005986 [Phenylobacterium sp.]